MASDDDELRLNRSHSLIFAHAQLDCDGAILVAALADEFERPLASIPHAGPFPEPLVQGAEAHLVLGHLLLARLHESDSKPIEISQAG